jgi:vacuolar-type H+-ATPase subunit E/Vma4
LRTQAAPAASVYQLSEEEQQGLIGKVLVEARAQAEEMVRAAKQEADTATYRARQKVDQLRAEQERVHSQLQGISYGLRNILRDSAGAEYQQRGEEFAAS